jgi:hypothetical protein
VAAREQLSRTASENRFETGGEIEMLMLVLTWIGIALGTTLLLLMALGPVIVEMDGWFAHRRRDRKRVNAAAPAASAVSAVKVAAPRPLLHG